MIYQIVDSLVTALTTLSFKDVLVGIAKPLKVNDNGKIRTMPVAYNANPDACSIGSYYLDLIPNSTKKSIIYFEEDGTKINGYTKDYIDMTSKIRLIGWFNFKKINKNLHTSTLLVANVMKLIPARLANMTYINSIRIEFDEELPQTPALFGRYDYNEAEHQYITYPYGCFGLVYTINYRVNLDCVPLITEDLEPC